MVLDGAVKVDKYDAVDIEGELTKARCVESVIESIFHDHQSPVLLCGINLIPRCSGCPRGIIYLGAATIS